MSDVPVDLSSVLAALSETFDEPIRSTLNRESPFLSVLPKRPYAGEQVDWRVSVGGLSVINPNSGADWGANASLDTKKKLTLGWGRYACKVIVGFDALTAAAKAPSGAFDAIVTEAQEGVRAIAKAMDDDLFDGTGSGNTLVGLETAIDATATYAGINPSDVSAWASTEDGATSTVLTEGNLDTALEDVASAWGSPLGGGDVIVTTHALRAKLKALLTASGNRTHQIMTDAGGQPTVTLHGGASGVIFSGVPVIADPDCTTSCLYLCRLSEMEFRYMPFTVPGNDSPVMVPVRDRAGNVIGSQPSIAHVFKLANTGDHIAFGVIVQAQLVVRHRKASGKLFAKAS